MKQLVILGMALAVVCAGIAKAAFTRDGAVIRNTGSTNFSGYTIKVWSDGSTWAVHSNRAGTPLDAPVTSDVPPNLAQHFLQEAKQAKNNRVMGQSCMKSASFGTSTVVLYHGWTSPDLECPGDGLTVALAADAHKIAALLKISGEQPHRIPMLPNEKRRVPSEAPSGQPSATPEPTNSAS
ncbi:MAG TPA: hypothetical protein VJP85_07790 [Candidatus Baltobacteraceae bacterium]|nr:hypothetical protein [Candidatus Baltobacteraceae bacterium]